MNIETKFTNVFNVKENMSFAHYLKSYLYYLKDRNGIKRFMLYRRTYRNYFDVIMHVKKGKYPIDVILSDGNHSIINHPYQVYANLMGLNYDMDNDIVTAPMEGSAHQIRFHGGINNGEITGIFLNKQYHFLPVKGRIVVDIGANIGDSPIYFALQGAEKVIALEPYLKNYETAKKNIELNHLSDKILLVQAACSSKDGHVTIDQEAKNSVTSQLRESATGVKVPLLTLNNILNTYNVVSAVLKMDCEGCEYDAILSSSDDTLRKFSHIQLEYHYGYRNIKEKLEGSGFTVSSTSPRYSINNESPNPQMYVGWLYAKRNQ